MEVGIQWEGLRSELRVHVGCGGWPGVQIRAHPYGVDVSRYPTRVGRVCGAPAQHAQAFHPSVYGEAREARPALQPDAVPSHALGSGGNAAPRERPNNWPAHHFFYAIGSAAENVPPVGNSREVERCGCNSWGNFYTTYSDSSYHYDNQDGSVYDRHPDGSARYTSPLGETYEYHGTSHEGSYSRPGGWGQYDAGYGDYSGYHD
mmetsp:Transcript_47480/g.95841  ORF Transcript_47480/g.95841 Transcript_47480/m.95841 type:complete len:204 (-) Transcript_47480:214-825(-)